MEDSNSFGSRLRAAIEAIGESMSSFARVMDLTPSQVSDYVAGRVTPGLEVLARFQQRRGISIDWLLDGEGSMFRSESRVTAGAILSSALSRWEEWTLEDIDKFQSFNWERNRFAWIESRRDREARKAVIEEIAQHQPDPAKEDTMRQTLVREGVLHPDSGKPTKKSTKRRDSNEGR